MCHCLVALGVAPPFTQSFCTGLSCARSLPAVKMPVRVAGTVNGHFFGGVPEYVDVKKKPGYSPIPPPTVWDWVKNVRRAPGFAYVPPA